MFGSQQHRVNEVMVLFFHPCGPSSQSRAGTEHLHLETAALFSENGEVPTGGRAGTSANISAQCHTLAFLEQKKKKKELRAVSAETKPSQWLLRRVHTGSARSED
ncbi:hypothetical protein ACER0C_023758 [Sarotherodon galilaeus]